MEQWYVKEFSKFTTVSVRTLHYYDRIGLLKPSRPNSYRLYTKSDLLKLHKIIVLKFFGFELSQIKALLEKEADLIEQLSLQSKLLQKKAENLLSISETLDSTLSGCKPNHPIPWEKIIQLIETSKTKGIIHDTTIGKILDGKNTRFKRTGNVR